MTNKFNENEIIEGIITSIKHYGVFLSFEYNYTGLLHISEISKNFVNDINKYFSKGDKILVLVKTINDERKFLTVSLKDLPDDKNKFLNINPSKKITSYIKDIDFSKLKKSLPYMINKELKREENYDN